MKYACLFLLPACLAQVNVLTYHNDLARTGQNLNETVLTLANVNPSQFGKLFSYPVDGYVYAQPLYVSTLAIPGNGIHNVVLVATEHDSVYAFDADGGGMLWKVSFLNSDAGVTTVPAQNTNCDQIVPEIGITGTPVIDLSTGTLYLVAMTLETSRISQAYVQRLHAIDITTGSEKPGSPVVIQGSVPGTGEGGSTVTFNARNYKQRPGLVLLNGVVYTSWSSHCDIGKYHGWIIAYDAQTLRQVAVYNNTSNGNQGSFWASGAAPAVDGDGNLYLVAGNGTFDANQGGQDLGESFIKLSTVGGLSAVDYFAPFNAIALNDRDLDIGSSGVVLLPDEAGGPSHPHVLVSAGKEGRVYVIDRDNMGHFQSGSDSQIVQSLSGVVDPLFGIPAYFNKTVYFSGSGDAIKAFPVSNGMLATAPASRSAAQFGYPGTVPSISANGSVNGIVWVIDPAARLRAYDAANLTKLLYDSGATNGRDSLGSYVKFSAPAIANGKVYVGTERTLAVFGLLAAQATPSLGAVVNAASFQSGGVAPGSIVSAFGANLALDSESASGTPLPIFLAGAELLINGIPAPLFYASPSQLNAQLPYEVPTGTATAVVMLGNNASAPIRIIVQQAAPAIFTIGPNQAAALNSDGAVNGPDRPAAPGSTLQVFCTGLGPTDRSVATGVAAPSTPLVNATLPLGATIGNQTADISFAGLAPGLVGVFQVNMRVPVLPPGAYPLIIRAGGASSNSASVTIGP